MRVGLCGTFDIENFGDVLFPLVARHELGARLGDVDVVAYSYGEKAGDWPYEVRSLRHLDDDLDELDAIVVGGGHILRFDKAIAAGYQPPVPSIAHPGGYWLAPMLAAIARGVPVAWNAPSASPDPPDWARPLLALAALGSAYVSVRDQASARLIERAGVPTAVSVVPDSVFGLPRVYPSERCSDLAAPLLRKLGVSGPFLVVQGTPTVLPPLEGLVAAGIDHDIVVVPVGPALGDDAAIVVDRFPGAVACDPWPDVATLAALIACSGGVIGRSLHLSITALAYGHPVLRTVGPLAEKYLALEPARRLWVWAEGDQGAASLRAFVTELGVTCAEPFVVTAGEQLTGHWDRVADVVTSGSRTRTKRANTAATFEAVNGLLIDAETRANRADAQLADAGARVRALAEEGVANEAEWRQEVTELERRLEAASTALAESETQAAALRSSLGSKLKELDACSVRVEAIEAELAAGRTAYETMLASRSRRLTRPLRQARSRLRRARRRLSARARGEDHAREDSCHRCYHDSGQPTTGMTTHGVPPSPGRHGSQPG